MGRIQLFLATLLCPLSALAGLNWEPITAADWQAGKADSLKSANAIILFEKVIVDERNAAQDIYSTTIYRRIKIVNQRGYGQADVSVPYVHKKQKITDMKGRTLWPNGRVFNLSKKQIFRTDMLSTRKVSIKQKAFSLPGIQDGCIIEYMFTFESPSRVSYFEVQKELPVLQYELSWYFFNWEIPYGLVVTKDYRKELESHLTSPFIRSYNLPQHEVLQPKSAGNPDADCLKFKAGPLTAYEDEPLSVNSVYTQGAVILFYNKRSGDYWAEAAEEVWEGMQEFAKNRSRFDDQYQHLAESAGSAGYIQTVYNWIARNIHNTDYDEVAEGSKPKPIETLDDVIINKRGSSYDINRLFYFFLRKHGLRPELGFVADRRERIVDSGIPEWQFEESVVLLSVRRNVYETYMPGTRHLQAGCIPYYYEGTTAFAVDSLYHNWRDIPFSSAAENCAKRLLELDLSDDGSLTGKFSEQSQGQMAWFRRTSMNNEDSTEAMDDLRETLQNLMPLAEFDSIRCYDADSLYEKIVLTCQVKFPPLARCTGQDYFLQPSDYVGREGNLLVAGKRTSQILMNFASDIYENLQLKSAEGWEVHSTPVSTSYNHLVGTIENAFASVGGSISMQRRIMTRIPFWKTEDYLQVQKFFQKRTLLNNELIVLKKKGIQS